MDYAKAIAQLKTLEVEGVADLVSAIVGKVEALEAQKYEVIGEKRTATGKLQTMEQALQAIAKTVGIEGTTEDILSGTEAKVREISQKAQSLETEKSTLETRASQAETKLKGLERKGKITEIAAKAGANAAVLEKLLGDRLDDLKLDGETVKLGDVALKEAIAADESLKLFEAALFPGGEPPKKEESKPAPRLPGGSPGGGNDSGKDDPLAGYLQKTYAIPGQKQGS